MGRNVIAELSAKYALKAPPRTNWQPKYPEFAAVPSAEVSTEIDDENTGWTPSQATSEHVQEFKKWFPFTQMGKKLSGGTYQIFVRFRPKPEEGIGVSEYVYYFKSRPEAERIWGLLTTDPHPGVVIDQELVKKGVPYKCLVKGW